MLFFVLLKMSDKGCVLLKVGDIIQLREDLSADLRGQREEE